MYLKVGVNQGIMLAVMKLAPNIYKTFRGVFRPDFCNGASFAKIVNFF